MADQRRDSSVLFSLRELKGMEQTPERSKPDRAAPDRKHASDEKGSLLAELRASVDEVARVETARLEAVRAAREAEDRAEQARRRAEAAAEVEARIQAEEARRRLVESERRGAESRLRGEAVDILPAGPPQALSRAAPAPVAPAPPSFLQPTEPDGGQRATGFYLVVVGIPVACLSIIVLALLWTERPLPTNGPSLSDIPLVASAAPATPTAAPVVTARLDPKPAPVVGVSAAQIPPSAAGHGGTHRPEGNTPRPPRPHAPKSDAPLTVEFGTP